MGAGGMGGGGRTHRLNTVSFHAGGNMIDYADEDPMIREMFGATSASQTPLTGPRLVMTAAKPPSTDDKKSRVQQFGTKT